MIPFILSLVITAFGVFILMFAGLLAFSPRYRNFKFKRDKNER